MARWLVLPGNSQVLAVHAVLLHTGSRGQILLFSGDEHDRGQHDRGQIDHTRLFDCATLTLTDPHSPVSDLFCSGHALLSDGRVLVAGGTEAFPDEVAGIHAPHFPGLRDSWIFDPPASAWRSAAPMNPEPGRTTGGGRWYPTLLTLQSGQVLALSGHPREDDTRHTNNSPELFTANEGAGSWLLAGPSDPAHEMTYYPRLHLLPDGQVFCSNPVGGRTQKLKPTTSAWTDLAGPAPGIYDGFASTSVLLPLLPSEGYRARVLLCGDTQPLLFDLGAPALGWRPTAPRALAGAPQRRNLSTVLLPTGEVFVCGGVSASNNSDGSAVLTAESYDPGTNRWTALERATVVRNYHSVALLMPDGRVWTAGSNHNAQQSFPTPGVDNRELRMELYEPWYYSQPRPRITSVSAALDYGQRFELRSPQAAAIRKVALIRTGSSTHAFNADQRYVGLSFTHTGGDRLEFTAPPDNRIAPPGQYLLFILDDRGVPSEGHFVHFRTPTYAGNPTLIQGRFGGRGNFEVVVPLEQGGLAHHWRNNDHPTLPWNGPTLFGTGAGHVDAASLIQSTYGSPGNLEVVARIGDRLALFWRDSGPALSWQGPFFFASGAAGNPSLIRSRFGRMGNFELVVPHASGGLAHYWRNNDLPAMLWSGPGVFGSSAGRVDAVTLIQSNYGSPGNLEVVARIGDRLAFFWRDSGPAFAWHGPFFFASGVAGVPSLVQSRFGRQGNFELVVPMAAGGLGFFWRNNDVPSMPWSGPDVFGTAAGHVDAASLIQSNYGSPGNLEVVARAGNQLLFFWRDSGPAFTWHGPFPIALL